jgi:hypothetical protein
MYLKRFMDADIGLRGFASEGWIEAHPGLWPAKMSC